MSEEPESKVGLAIGGAMLLGLAAYAFSGGKGNSGGYLEAWKKEQDAEGSADPVSEEVPSDDDASEGGDDPTPSLDEPPLTEEESAHA